MLLKGGRVASIPREQSLMGLLFTPRGGEGVTGVPPNAMEFVSFPQERDPEGQRTDEEFRYHADATGLPKSGVFSGELGGRTGAPWVTVRIHLTLGGKGWKPHLGAPTCPAARGDHQGGACDQEAVSRPSSRERAHAELRIRGNPWAPLCCPLPPLATTAF